MKSTIVFLLFVLFSCKKTTLHQYEKAFADIATAVFDDISEPGDENSIIYLMIIEPAVKKADIPEELLTPLQRNDSENWKSVRMNDGLLLKSIRQNPRFIWKVEKFSPNFDTKDFSKYRGLTFSEPLVIETGKTIVTRVKYLCGGNCGYEEYLLVVKQEMGWEIYNSVVTGVY